jgi:antitoxin Phd
MKSYSLTELNQRSGEVIEAALSGPVELTKRGRRKYVILTAERYDVLTQGASTRRVVHVDDLSEEEANFYLEGLARANQEDENDSR